MTSLEKKRKERSVTRRLFTKCANELDSVLVNENESRPIESQVMYTKLNNLRKDIVKLDKLIKDLILENFTEEELEKELDEAMKYETKWLILDATYKKSISDTMNCNNGGTQRNLKLPKLQLHIFDGEIKNWLAFWGQFSKIHDDTHMDNLDKYQYLLQSMKDDSDVKQLVESFPPIAYSDCVKQLKARYAREDLLIQIYVREILTLVLVKDDSITITQLYDKLNSQLRALDSLGVTKDKYAAFLLPMVESALNQECLRTWERTRGQSKDAAEELANLLKFLQKEVESEQRIELTKKTFKNKEQDNLPKQIQQTAECLLTGIKPKKATCVWCDKETHSSVECYKMLKMTLEQRRQILKEKKACGICLRKGHHPKICKASVKCLLCHKRHSTVMCPDQKAEEKPSNKENTETSTLSSVYKKEETLLQTILVEVESGGRKMYVRALLDSGSQRTYIKQDITEKLKIPVIGKENLTHCLFGGVEISSKECNVYKFTIQGLNNASNFKLDIMAIGQNNICGNIPKYDSKNVQLNNLLQEHNITLTDLGNKTEIGLLIGADFLGFLLTGTLVKLKDGLVAVKTCLGWTLQGKQVSMNSSLNNHTTMLHCTCIDDNLTDFWSLETLGIRDPFEVKSKAEVTADIMATFEENIKRQDSRGGFPGGSQNTSFPPTDESTTGNETSPNKPQTNSTGCGVTGAAYEDKWKFFRSGECPWCAAIYRTGGNPRLIGPNGYWCAGALIHEKVVLTSAACAYIAKKSQLTVNVGETDLSNNERRPSQEKKVVNYHLHPNYRSGTKANDIGLLILESSIELTIGTDAVAQIGLVCLPKTETEAFSTCSAGGWGPTADGQYQNRPINMRLTRVDKVSCESWYRQNEASRGFEIRDGSFCAQRTGDTDTCPVGRGAPFFCTSENLGRRFVLQGIGSFAPQCNDTAAPAIFTEVSHFVPWIRDEITKLT